MALLVVWVCNNSYWNARSVWLMHKILTLILVFKALGVYASFSLFMSCPFDRVSFGLLQLVQNQFQTLYETSFLCLLLVLSKGLFLTRNEFSRPEFNYISILASIIYVTVSAYNIMGNQISLFVLGMYAGLWIHCTIYSRRAYQVILQRISLAEATQVSDMTRAFIAKKHMFRAFWVALQVYFLGEMTVHLIITDFSFGLLDNYYEQWAVNVAVHQALEFFVIASIFYVYRARPHERFFSLLNEGESIPRMTVVYKTSMFSPVCEIPDEAPIESPIVIVNPGSAWNSGYPYEQVTLGKVEKRTAEAETKPKRSGEVSHVEMMERP